MSLWAEYREERGDAFFIEEDNGFASYSITDEECYLQDIYIRSEFRGTGLGAKLTSRVIDIAKSEGCKLLTGTVVVGSKNDTLSLKIFIDYGMKILKIRDNLIVLYMNI